MGIPGRKRKDYVMRSTTVSESIENLPPGYQFEISNHQVDFNGYKQFEDKHSDIAWGFAIVIWRRRNDISGDTAKNHLQAIDRFFEFKRIEVANLSLQDINQEVVNRLVNWIKYLAYKRRDPSEQLTESSKRKTWGVLRGYLNDLIRFGMISPDIDLPSHAFESNTEVAFKRYSTDEAKQILQACLHDIHAIRQGNQITVDGRYTAYIARLIPHALLISLRTGINPEVLFEMDVTKISLKQSHLLNSTILVLPVKNRSRRSQNIELLNDSSNISRVKNDIVRLFKEVEQMTLEARNSLPNGHALKNKLWLVESDEGRIDVFRNFAYYESLQNFSWRHQIRDQDGQIIEINFRRFRPTFAEDYLKINGGDVRDLQKRLGQQNLRTTMGYLDPNIEERKVEFKFAGTAMVNWALRSENSQTIDSIAKDLNIPYDAAEKLVNGDFNMGVTKCKNPLESPLKGKKSGELCTEYLACFRCGNCVVLQEDSHRLFSFYHWLISKQSLLGHEKWKATYGWIIDIIDKDIAPQLGSDEWIQQEKARAKSYPFPMWPLQNIGEEKVAS